MPRRARGASGDAATNQRFGAGCKAHSGAQARTGGGNERDLWLAAAASAHRGDSRPWGRPLCRPAPSRVNIEPAPRFDSFERPRAYISAASRGRCCGLPAWRRERLVAVTCIVERAIPASAPNASIKVSGRFLMQRTRSPSRLARAWGRLETAWLTQQRSPRWTSRCPTKPQTRLCRSSASLHAPSAAGARRGAARRLEGRGRSSASHALA